MASPQPLVCTSLHLPPDLQPFLRIHEISLQIFLPNLDRLRLALEADQAINPEATNIFFDTRKVLREELQKSFTVLQAAQELADRYFEVLKALSEKKSTQERFFNVNLGALAGMVCSREAQQGMAVFRREFESAITRVTAILNTKYKEGSKTLLTSTENTQAVSEILTTIDECNELLKQCNREFAKLAKQTRNESSVDSNLPSEEETQLMRAKWQTFLDNIRDVWKHGFTIANQILWPTSDNPPDPSASERRKSPKKVPLWRNLFQRQDKRDLIRLPNTLPGIVGPEAAFGTSPELQMNVANPVNPTGGLVASGIREDRDDIPTNGHSSKIPFRKRLFLFLTPKFIV
ncbi:hypothetical protein AGABI2DRAFT_119063 [Agaricus bisporus var. bisporus H97]|uniref:hypothetical protein n=1 Tax=Agaricus bisporus var. bisporus (strain H97 / ATCC MYA-4626 / FGSC 10389) TaxID=936046 RepID=UPI00029F670F|nr:hypothetical protein AGABI2DRAFT_119063 [Agaricus bisporus var. bisporus H97]EKV46885.1 hypothetical protein AGABI2DRAFT_119063 [Agaricus bisporus var. bisporus H97]